MLATISKLSERSFLTYEVGKSHESKFSVLALFFLSPLSTPLLPLVPLLLPSKNRSRKIVEKYLYGFTKIYIFYYTSLVNKRLDLRNLQNWTIISFNKIYLSFDIFDNQKCNLNPKENGGVLCLVIKTHYYGG